MLLLLLPAVHAADDPGLTLRLFDVAGVLTGPPTATVKGHEGREVTVVLTDDGAPGDEVPGDGLHGARVASWPDVEAAITFAQADLVWSLMAAVPAGPDRTVTVRVESARTAVLVQLGTRTLDDTPSPGEAPRPALDPQRLESAARETVRAVRFETPRAEPGRVPWAWVAVVALLDAAALALAARRDPRGPTPAP